MFDFAQNFHIQSFQLVVAKTVSSNGIGRNKAKIVILGLSLLLLAVLGFYSF